MLDRETVTIPARDVRRPEAAHGLITEDGVLEQFIEGGADVHIAVSERRAVMEHEGRLAGGAGLNLPVETVTLPVGEADGFAFG